MYPFIINQKISQFIQLDHKVAWMSDNLHSLDDAEIICLTENHTNTMQKVHNGILIQNIAHFGPYLPKDLLVLLECDRSAPISHERIKSHETTAQLKYPVIQFKGWDLANKELKQMGQIIYRAKRGDDLIQLMKQAWPEYAEQINPQNARAAFKEYELRFEHVVIDTFQSRNASMIEVLENTQHCAKLRFVIGGTNHFLNRTMKTEHFAQAALDGRVSVNLLQEYLKDKKAVILVPK